jgi:hypothetical protein
LFSSLVKVEVAVTGRCHCTHEICSSEELSRGTAVKFRGAQRQDAEELTEELKQKLNFYWKYFLWRCGDSRSGSKLEVLRLKNRMTHPVLRGPAPVPSAESTHHPTQTTRVGRMMIVVMDGGGMVGLIAAIATAGGPKVNMKHFPSRAVSTLSWSVVEGVCGRVVWP